jgi:hypothetical protein
VAASHQKSNKGDEKKSNQKKELPNKIYFPVNNLNIYL